MTFLDRVRELVSELTSQRHYDAVFVDARAGLNESTAASVLGLGAQVLLFAVDFPQTFEGYGFLLAHLARFATANASADWRQRFQLVHAKASLDPAVRRRCHDRGFDLFSRWLYDEADFDDTDAFNFDIDDESAPHFPWPILHYFGFLDFDPVANPEVLTQSFTERTFGPFIDRLCLSDNLPFASTAIREVF